MAIRANVAFKNIFGRPDSRVLGPNQSIIIGSSNFSDLQLPAKDDVKAQHCCIRLTKDKCTVEDLTAGSGILLAQGEPISSVDVKEELKVQIGQTEIEITVNGGIRAGKQDEMPSALPVFNTEVRQQSSEGVVVSEANSPVEANTPIDEGEDELDREFVQYRRLASGLHSLSCPDDEDGEKLLVRILENRPYIESINFLAVGESPSDKGLDNLLQNLMDEPNDSLTFVGPESFDHFPSAMLESKADDHRMLLFPMEEVELEDFQKSVQIHLGWMIRPSRFHFNMQNGLKNLIDAVFTELKAVVFFSLSDGAWILLTLDDSLVADYTGDP